MPKDKNVRTYWFKGCITEEEQMQAHQAVAESIRNLRLVPLQRAMPGSLERSVDGLARVLTIIEKIPICGEKQRRAK